MSRYEVVIVGGGVAGISLAWALAQRGVGDVLILEREEHPGTHATGRSAASLVELDPNPVLQRLKFGGAAFLRAPPPGFADVPLLVRSGILLLYGEPAWSALRESAPPPGVRADPLTPAEAAARVPALAPGAFAGGLFLPEDGHIDVDALLGGYLRGARRAGATLRTGVEVTGVRVEQGRVRGLDTAAGERIDARWIVDAAGAWAGNLARLAGAAPVCLTPRRRSIATFAAPPGLEPSGWPLVAHDDEHVYFAPESGGLLLSPMDETPSAPCDARADDLAIAGAIERLRVLAPPLVPPAPALRRRWAGLRTFAPDRALVVGEDPVVRGFFWLAGQGGCGIETSPFVSAIACDLLLHGRSESFDVAALAPGRASNYPCQP